VNSKKYDFIVIGAGIVGLSIARELIKSNKDSEILVIEKENAAGKHASGRNSGVLHSGLYYPDNTLKSKVCSKGSRLMFDYCVENNLPVSRIGKVIVPTSYEDDKTLDILYKRALSSGIDVDLIDERQLLDIEPYVYSISGRSLHSPNTAIIDPEKIINKIVSDLISKGVEIMYNTKITRADPSCSQVTTSNGINFTYGHLYNASGQFTDKISHLFNVGVDYTILPFKGNYRKLVNTNVNINGLVYPAPNLNMPFLGIHSVKNMKGEIFFGPSSIPAFGRENYEGIKGVNFADASSISFHLIYQYIENNHNFRGFSHEEFYRFFKVKFLESARLLFPSLGADDLIHSSKTGIRAQLLNKKKHVLEMDFIVESTDNTTHVLNSVSPAFTSAFEFSKYIVAHKNNNFITPKPLTTF